MAAVNSTMTTSAGRSCLEDRERGWHAQLELIQAKTRNRVRVLGTVPQVVAGTHRRVPDTEFRGAVDVRMNSTQFRSAYMTHESVVRRNLSACMPTVSRHQVVHGHDE